MDGYSIYEVASLYSAASDQLQILQEYSLLQQLYQKYIIHEYEKYEKISV